MSTGVPNCVGVPEQSRDFHDFFVVYCNQFVALVGDAGLRFQREARARASRRFPPKNKTEGTY